MSAVPWDSHIQNSRSQHDSLGEQRVWRHTLRSDLQTTFQLTTAGRLLVPDQYRRLPRCSCTDQGSHYITCCTITRCLMVAASNGMYSIACSLPCRRYVRHRYTA